MAADSFGQRGGSGNDPQPGRAARKRAPAGGTRFRGKYYRAGQWLPLGLPSKERYACETADGRPSLDPARQVAGAPPNFGRNVVPHLVTFQALSSNLAKVYRNPDEAVRHSLDNARIMRNDCAIMECLEARQRATALLNWHLEPEDAKEPRQQEIADGLTRVIREIPRFTEYRRVLLEALWYGRYAVEHQYGLDYRPRPTGGLQKRVLIRQWTPLNGDKLLFRFDDGTGDFDPNQIGIRVRTAAQGRGDIIAGRRCYELAGVGYGYFLEPWERCRLVVHKHMVEDVPYEDVFAAGSIHGIGIRSRIYWSWFQRQETLAQLMEVVEKTGQGFTIYRYPSGNLQARQEMEAVATEQAYSNVILLPVVTSDPGAYGIEQLPANTAGLDALRSIVHEHFGHQIKRYILGQILTSETEPTGMGSETASLHKESFLDIVRYDSGNLDDTLTHELVTPLLRMNYPKHAGMQLRFRSDLETTDPEKKLAAIRTAWEMGAAIKAADVMDLVGLSLPTQSDHVLTKQPAAKPSINAARPQRSAPANGQVEHYERPWDESKHPRGQPDNAGQFVEVGHGSQYPATNAEQESTSAEADRTAEPPPDVDAFLSWERMIDVPGPMTDRQLAVDNIYEQWAATRPWATRKLFAALVRAGGAIILEDASTPAAYDPARLYGHYADQQARAEQLREAANEAIAKSIRPKKRSSRYGSDDDWEFPAPPSIPVRNGDNTYYFPPALFTHDSHGRQFSYTWDSDGNIVVIENAHNAQTEAAKTAGLETVVTGSGYSAPTKDQLAAINAHLHGVVQRSALTWVRDHSPIGVYNLIQDHLGLIGTAAGKTEALEEVQKMIAAGDSTQAVLGYMLKQSVRDAATDVVTGKLAMAGAPIFTKVAKKAKGALNKVDDTAEELAKRGPQGGEYGKVRSANQGGEVHHVPAAKVTPYNYRNAPSIWMETADHRKTLSWGSSRAAAAHRAKQAASLIKESCERRFSWILMTSEGGLAISTMLISRKCLTHLALAIKDVTMEIVPFVSVGILRFGDTRQLAREKLASSMSIFKKGDANDVDSFDDLGLHLHYSNTGRLEFIEAFDPASIGFRGICFLGRDLEAVGADMRPLGLNAVETDVGIDYAAAGIALTAPTGIVEGVAAYRRGYYDG